MANGFIRALGLMSGTSADGIDAAIVTTDGETVQAFGPRHTVPYAPALRARVLAAMAVGQADAGQADPNLSNDLTLAAAAAARTIMGDGDVALVGLHGQTILHDPAAGRTVQIGCGATLAELLGVPVVDQFRRADVAAGGQGAPLVPAFHAALADGLGPVAVLNVGGVANVTFVGDGPLLAFDTGPGGALMDDWVGRHTGAAYDRDGALAAAGQVQADRLAALLDHPYFTRPPPKSLDRHAFSLASVQGLSPADGAATLLAFTVAAVVCAAAYAPPRRWLVCGGGRHNGALMAALRAALPQADPVEAVGWDGDALEAQAFAFLAVRSLRGLPLSWPGTTGVPAPQTGGTLHQPGHLAPPPNT